jgi:hypothetical protein
MDTCLCCAKQMPVSGRKTCPLCGHSLMGNGWTGLDFHWKLRHEAQVPYRTFWTGLCQAHRDPQMPAQAAPGRGPDVPPPAVAVPAAPGDGASPPGGPLVQGLVGAIAQELWRRNHWLDLQVFRDQVDTARFDLVLGCSGWMRYLQILPASSPLEPGPYPVRSDLSQLEGGCAVVLVRSAGSQEPDRFLFFGGEIGESMPSVDAFPASERPVTGSALDAVVGHGRYRDVPRAQFGPVLDVAGLVARLFPPAPVLRLSPALPAPASRRRHERGQPAGRRLGDQGETTLVCNP